MIIVNTVMEQNANGKVFSWRKTNNVRQKAHAYVWMIIKIPLSMPIAFEIFALNSEVFLHKYVSMEM